MNKPRARINALDDYKKVNTYILALLPFGYGIATLLNGDALWRTDDLGVHSPYSVASQVPWSPESWGSVAILFGILMAVGEFTGNSKVIFPGVLGCALWYAFFSVSFVFDYFQWPETKVGLPPAYTYFFLSFLFVNRAVYSFRMVRIDNARQS